MGICDPSLLDIYDYPQARSANFRLYKLLVDQAL